jgi:rare lipoprotein A
LALAACAGGPEPGRLPSGGVYKVGQPYVVLGRRYVPSDDRDYDERGIASWYGPGFHGKSTANGERFDADTLSAAHKTLPMPSFVEVTNLDNGRKLTVRINDRGPFVGDRIIDLSRKSAQLLGLDRAGTGRVRVRRVYPDAKEMARISRGQGAVVPPVAAPVVMPRADGPLWVQVAAVSDAGRASWLAGYLRDVGPTAVEATGTGLFRVRIGPFSDSAAAASALAQVRAAGYDDARVTGGAPIN